MLARVAAIARADAAIRLRRTSTVIVFLLLSAFAYFWIPDPATGRTILQIDGRRALYNSAALGMSTASLGTIFVGLFGFYVISNAVRRDTDTRCGLLLASTPMRAIEYVAGKFAGNLAFLSLFMAGFMATSMGMQVVRGEAPLRPLVFIAQYLLLVPPTIVFVAAIAVIFECTPFLNGRFGDVLYFFVWAASLGVVASSLERAGGSMLVAYFDFSGLGFLLEEMKHTLHTSGLSIGSSNFDASKPPFVFNGLTLPAKWILPRIVCTLMPMAALPVAVLFFHRFDPARIRGGRGSRTRWMGRINALLKPIARMPYAFARGAYLADALMTFTVAPWTLVALIAAAFVPLEVSLAITAIVVADVVTRDIRAGTVALIRSAPHLRERMMWWKLASTVIVAFLVMAVPILRATSPLAAIVATFFIAAAATALGVMSENPKAFVVLFLTFWYVVVNDRKTPALDFGGVHGAPPIAVTLAYAAVAVAFIAAGQSFHAFRLRRGE